MNSLQVIEIAQKQSQSKCLSQVDSVSHYQLEQKIPPVHFRLVRSLCELARTAPECCGRRSPPGAAASSCNTTPGHPTRRRRRKPSILCASCPENRSREHADRHSEKLSSRELHPSGTSGGCLVWLCGSKVNHE